MNSVHVLFREPPISRSQFSPYCYSVAGSRSRTPRPIWRCRGAPRRRWGWRSPTAVMSTKTTTGRWGKREYRIHSFRRFSKHAIRVVTRRCRLSMLTNSAPRIWAQMWGEWVAGVSANDNSCAHHVTWSPNELWRYNFIFILCMQYKMFSPRVNPR